MSTGIGGPRSHWVTSNLGSYALVRWLEVDKLCEVIGAIKSNATKLMQMRCKEEEHGYTWNGRMIGSFGSLSNPYRWINNQIHTCWKAHVLIPHIPPMQWLWNVMQSNVFLCQQRFIGVNHSSIQSMNVLPHKYEGGWSTIAYRNSHTKSSWLMDQIPYSSHAMVLGLWSSLLYLCVIQWFTMTFNLDNLSHAMVLKLLN